MLHLQIICGNNLSIFQNGEVLPTSVSRAQALNCFSLQLFSPSPPEEQPRVKRDK